MRSRPAVIVASATDIGRRRQNEDFLGYREPDDDESFTRLGRLTVVADGMGGAAGGATASRIVVETILAEYYSPQDREEIPASLGRALRVANEAVHRIGRVRPELSGLGTTATALALKGATAHLAHVGDSRAYLVRDGLILQLTEDHSFVNGLVKAGSISRAQARGHPMSHVITRCLGREPSVEVDLVGPIEVWPGDRFVLCSDGLSSTVENREIPRLLEGRSPGAACRGLVTLAKERGGSDNITVLVVALDGP